MNNSICIELGSTRRDGRNVIVLCLSSPRRDGTSTHEFPLVEGGIRPVDLETIHAMVDELVTDWALLYAPPQITLLDATPYEAR